MKKEFPIKDLGDLSYFLGIKVIKTSHRLFLSQHKYLVDLLDELSMSMAEGCATPIATKPVLVKGDGTPLANGTQYRKVIGALQYATTTRPDIS